jgi:hypothetical protein
MQVEKGMKSAFTLLPGVPELAKITAPQHQSTLNQIEQSQEVRSMQWRCTACRYIRHFTRAVPLEAALRCPRFKCTEFRVVP